MKIKFYLLPFSLILTGLPACNSSDIENAGNTDELYSVFQDPPASARPFVRWWWNGNCVTEKEVVRELDVMKAAGIGGVEINPIRMPIEQDQAKYKALEWISPEWNHVVKIASERAKENNMLVDMIVGSGWPFGGEFLEEGEIIQRVLTNQKDLVGPAQYRAKAQDLINEATEGYGRGAFENVMRSKILFIRLIPDELNDIGDCVDLDKEIRDEGEIIFEVPEGKFKLFIGIWQEGYERVTFGAPGSDGPVLDHMNAAAVQKYLDRLSDALEKEFGAELGAYLRALFCDSIELAGANWTTDFSDIFYKYCGYKLEPYLPFVFYKPGVGYKDEMKISPYFSLSLQKVRYDYNKVLVNTFLENFTQTFKNWCNEHGSLCRYQAYGLPWLVGLSEGYMIPDIPESNSWLNRERYFPKSEYNIWSKYASSSGHIMGNPIISCEANSNLDGVFKTTLEQIKLADDMNFITGITHTVLHGYNYSPPEAGFPGWIRFGTYFNEQNTWWPHFRLWSDYNSRLSAVFQASQPAAEVAILGPTADVWGDHGLGRDKFHNTPWYCYQLWKSFSHHGISVDYVNETMIQDAVINDGELGLGKMNYQMLILTDVKSILPATAKRIAEYADQGGKVIFVNDLPFRSPSMINAQQNDKITEELMKEAVSQNTGALLLDGPENQDNLNSWTFNVIETAKLNSPVRIQEPDPSVFQTHYVYKNQDIFFFCNQDKASRVQFEALFNRSEGIPWIWDPETGSRSVFSYGANPRELNIELGPLESMLIVFDKKKGSKSGVIKADETKYTTINSPWNIKFYPHIGTEFQIEEVDLPDLAASEDDRLNSFAGEIVYTTNIDIDNTDLILDLGEVYGISELWLNGEKIGSRWYGKHQYPINGIARKGINELEIHLTTTLYNFCRTQEENPEIARWLKTREPEPSGLLGPVKLFEAVW
jgi:hypothetical protein